MKHRNYTPTHVDPYGEDWRIIPVDGYGTQEMIRSVIRNEKPDILWFMTDPRFYEWLWEMENEIVLSCLWSIITFGTTNLFQCSIRSFMNQTTTSQQSQSHTWCVRGVAPDVDATYVPHA